MPSFAQSPMSDDSSPDRGTDPTSSPTRTHLTVTCRECGTTGHRDLPTMTIGGSAYVFTIDEDGTERLFVTHAAGTTLCYDCYAPEYDDHDGRPRP